MTETVTDVATAELESYFTAELGIDIAETEVLSEKLNLIVAVRAEADGVAYVVHQPLKLRRTSLFNGLNQEYRVLQRLQETAIPTQEPVLFCDDDSILGEPFFVTTYLDGEPIPLGTDIPKRFQRPQSRERVATLLVDTLAEIHLLEVEPVEDVCDCLTAADQVERATDRLDAVTNVTGREFQTLRAVGEWLLENAPDDSKTTLVHGDFRPGNVLLAGSDRPAITGVLDWETAVLGDPLTELGYLMLRWRDENDPTPQLDDLEARYSNEDALEYLRDANEHGLCPFSARPGSPSRRKLVDRYEDETGIRFENDQFYRAHAAFMLATVWADLHRHQIASGAESDHAPYVEYMAMLADSIVSGEFQL